MATKKAQQPKKVLLREYKVERDNDGKVLAITGKCTEKLGNKYCSNTRTIAPQDAFQVSRCRECQKKLQHRKIAAKRKARRDVIRKAKKAAIRAAQIARLARGTATRMPHTARLAKR